MCKLVSSTLTTTFNGVLVEPVFYLCLGLLRLEPMAQYQYYYLLTDSATASKLKMTIARFHVVMLAVFAYTELYKYFEIENIEILLNDINECSLKGNLKTHQNQLGQFENWRK